MNIDMTMSENSTRKDFTDTWMLFESGSAVPLNAKMHDYSAPDGRPVNAYVVTKSKGAPKKSALRAAESVYEIARQKHMNPGCITVAYDLMGLDVRWEVVGASGGLAFAIAFAKQLFEHDPGPVAATGDILNSGNGGPVGPIKGVAKKLTAAGQVMKEGGWIFYPDKNNGEISKELRESLSEKGLKLHAVSSVEEALGILFPSEKKETVEQQPQKETAKQRPKAMWALLPILVALFIGGGLWIHSLNRSALEDPPIKSEKSAPENGIHLTGGSSLAQEIATLTMETVRSGNPAIYKGGRLSGDVRIMRIIEKRKDGKSELRAEMTVSVKNVFFIKGEERVANPPLIAKVVGEGSANHLAGKAATALAAEIGNIISPSE